MVGSALPRPPSTRRRRRRPPITPEEREDARQRILAEAAAQAQADDAAEGGARGSGRRRRHRPEQPPDSQRPSRRQRTSSGRDDAGHRWRLHAPPLRPRSPESVERAAAQRALTEAAQAGGAEREPAARPERETADRVNMFHAGFPLGPFRPFPGQLDEDAPFGMLSGLSLAFVFEIAQEVMRAASSQPPRRGAKKEVVNALPRVSGCPDDVCLVCQDSFTTDERPARMPCGHKFHLDCLKPWLSEHNTCPTCRYELDTDDERYNRKLAAQREKRAAGEGVPTEDLPPVQTQTSGGATEANPAPAAAPAAAPTARERMGDEPDSNAAGRSVHRRALAALAIANLQRSTADLQRAHEELREQLRASQRRQRRRDQRAAGRAVRVRDGSGGPPPLPDALPDRDQWGPRRTVRTSLPVSPILEARNARPAESRNRTQSALPAINQQEVNELEA